MCDVDDKIVSSVTSVSAHDWLLLCLLGVIGLVGFLFLVRALLLIPPTTVAVLRASEIVLAYGIQAIVVGQVERACLFDQCSYLLSAGSRYLFFAGLKFGHGKRFGHCNGKLLGHL